MQVIGDGPNMNARWDEFAVLATSCVARDGECQPSVAGMAPDFAAIGGCRTQTMPAEVPATGGRSGRAELRHNLNPAA